MNAAPGRAWVHRGVWSVFGMPVDAVSLDQAEAHVRAAIRARRRLSFVTPNLNWLVRALRDDTAMRQVREADLSLADGAPVVWLARKLGAPLPERVAGSDLFQRLRQPRPGEPPISVFFFGGRAGAAEKAAEALNAEAGGMVACGHLNPGYGDVAAMSTPDIMERINRARPDFLVVSLGAAKGQAWISANQDRLEVPVIAHLGAVVDFVAGTVARAPAWMQRAGLEWLWRILAEPALFRRYGSDGWSLLRLVPGRLWPLRRRTARLPERGPARIETVISAEPYRLALQGDFSGDLDDLRTAFAEAVASDRDVMIALGGVGRIDARLPGLIALLQARLGAAGRGLTLTGAPAPLAETLQIHALPVVPVDRPANHATEPVSRSLTS